MLRLLLLLQQPLLRTQQWLLQCLLAARAKVPDIRLKSATKASLTAVKLVIPRAAIAAVAEPLIHHGSSP
jgi:hypothetical protein